VIPAPTIASIVEGHGEVQALPVLLRRIAGDVFGVHHLNIPPPFRVRRNRMVKELSRAATFQSVRVTGVGGVLVLADADDDCPVVLAEELREAAKPRAIEVAIAVREFEARFLGGFGALRGHQSVRGDAAYEGDPESPRAAKSALSSLMTEPYRETLHQPAFAALMDLHQARRVRSFAHLVGCVRRLLGR
jgi:hypothetical protein